MNLHVQLVAGRTCKVRDKLCCTSCNVIYLINCKLCKEQYEDFAFKGKFKPRFRVHKRDVKLVKIDVVWCSLLSFAKVLILIRYSWNFMAFPGIYLGRHFGKKKISKNLPVHWWRHHFWTLVSWNLSRKSVNILYATMLFLSYGRGDVLQNTLLLSWYQIIIVSDVIMTSKLVKLYFFQQKFLGNLRKNFVICLYCWLQVCII